MLIPKFTISQDEQFLIITIYTPYVKISNTDVYVEKNKFTFYLKPYLLNLNFKNDLIEKDPESCVYNHNTYEFEFKLRKQNAGESFDDVNMINELFNKKKQVNSKKEAKIEKNQKKKLFLTIMNTHMVLIEK